MNPIQGLQQFDPSSDPSGIALQQRAQARRQVDMNENPYAHMMGPLPDPQWDGYFQALGEAGVDKLAGGASPAESRQLTGYNTNGAVGTEEYGGRRGMEFTGSPYQPPVQQSYNFPGATTPPPMASPQAPMTGLQAAAPPATPPPPPGSPQAPQRDRFRSQTPYNPYGQLPKPAGGV